MNPLALINPEFTWFDSLGLAAMFLLWLVVGYFIEHPPATRRSVSVIMEGFRREWMQEFIARNQRIADIALIESLRQSTAFFTSAAMIAIGGGVAMIGNSATLQGLASDLTILQVGDLIPLKFVVVIGILANALLNFVWSMRLFSYCGVLMGSVPNDPLAAHASLRAAQAAEINITAARNFNRGLRSIYTALGTLGWLMGPWGLLAGTVLTQGLLIRREFASQSRAALLATTLSDAALR
jgi:uncharacterized membrane protein